MPNFNRVFLVGNLTRDPELRYTPKGTAIARICLGIKRTWRDPETNATKEEVTFIDIDAWGKQAETIAQYVKKGRPLLVEGRLKLDSWEDKNTKEKRSKLGVVLESFQFLGDGQGRGAEGGGGFDSASSGSSRPRPAASASSAAPTGARSEPEAMPPEDDDVPF
ncbi:MAG: single-stranded DNA-binding protein [Verrucomicrobia bacterium]|nr:single-stranded DNA-binding protein [Verrucomicrobiota bacterium]